MSETNFIRLRNLLNDKESIDVLHKTASEARAVVCTEKHCLGSVLQGVKRASNDQIKTNEQVKYEAELFLSEYYSSIKRKDSEAFERRKAQVFLEIEKEEGVYELTTPELVFGAKTAWRNSSRCIGRIQWSKLQVFDARHIRTATEMFEALCNHINYATNRGQIRSAITIFPPRKKERGDFRIWNALLIRYAGYRHTDGSIIGDPASIEFTELCQKLGWKGNGGQFDILPLVLSANGRDPEWFNIPFELVLEVKFKHPEYDWFENLGLKWYALPAVSNMLFDCGGIEFPACPFNGWYMSTEIGCRNLCDPNRYNLTETIASNMNLDVTSPVTLWKDRAMLEVNKAVLYSFQKVNATIVDHHTASESFMKHLENEQKYRGGCPTDWVWVVPPLSSSLSGIFHQETVNYSLKPSYEYQIDAWKTFEWNKQNHNDKKKKTFKEIAKAVKFSAKLMGNALSKRIKCTILFASETGRSERYAGMLCDLFKTIFDVKFMCMDDYDTSNMEHETLLFVISSTSGNGDPPENGRKFAEFLYEKKREFFAEPPNNKRSSFLRMDSQETRNQIEERVRPFSNISFSVFGLGSSAYPKFCNYAKYVHRLFRELGAEEVLELVLGDELGGQEKEFGVWAKRAFRAACRTFYSADEANISDAFTQNWSKSRSRVRKLNPEKPISVEDGLSYISRRTIVRCKLMNRTQLQHKDSGRQTILIELDSTENPKETVYQPGDHIAIYPENCSDAVSQVLEFVTCSEDFSPDDVIQIERFEEEDSQQWIPDERFPINFTLRTALQRYMDISSPPSQLMLQQLAGLSKDEKDKNYLLELSENERKYEEWKYTKCPSLALLLKYCPSVQLPPILLLTQLPFLQPRFYSISSSPLSSPNKIDCTIAVVDYQLPNGGGLRKGVCSNWLNNLAMGSIIPCYVRPEPNFQLPDDPTTPIIAVGPGTGLAPFRSFWRNRLYNLKNKRSEMGKMFLYFGCRRKAYDYIYKEELEKCLDLGVISSLRVAFSREPNQPKVYVQNLLKEDGILLYDLLKKQNAHFYVCGDVSMAANVSTTLQIILEKVGGMNYDEASNFLLEIEDSNRFHQDIFGLTFKKSEITEKVRMTKLQSMENT